MPKRLDKQLYATYDLIWKNCICCRSLGIGLSFGANWNDFCFLSIIFPAKCKSCDLSRPLQLSQLHLFRTTRLYPSLRCSAASCSQHGQNTSAPLEMSQYKTDKSLFPVRSGCDSAQPSLSDLTGWHLAKPPTHQLCAGSGQLMSSISTLCHSKQGSEK